MRDSVFGIVVKQRASARIRTSFMNSLGWKLKLPIAIQRDARECSRASTKTSASATSPPT